MYSLEKGESTAYFGRNCKRFFFRVVYLSTGNVRGNEFDSSSLFFFGNSGIFFEFDIVASK